MSIEDPYLGLDDDEPPKRWQIIVYKLVILVMALAVAVVIGMSAADKMKG